ncbi:hypothetical protein EGW08_013553 [Elysia chlorotica]|uniref:Uncharacterized protein n=1 Tax=Elysia chlorotica TaxID=188477 RepID=A0A3S1BZ43_ELYCH|nr:hypothetical protein EGW08_013553 [Elysia chlorotica]
MAAANYNPLTGMSPYRNPNPTGLQSNFTFTAPTQCTTLGTPRPCIETISPINLSAPGVGASWQHSIPTTMPWVDMNSVPHNVHLGSATVFTGVPFNFFSGQVPPGSNILRRSKRKAEDVLPEVPVSKVHLCTDQLANMRITPSHHMTTEKTSQFDLQAESNSVDYDAMLDVRKPTTKSEDWERFRELESRLSTESDDELDQSPKRKEGIQFKVSDGILNIAQTSSPILPRKIMEDLNKPCMQIVLWQSPEKLIGDLTNDDSSADSQSSTATTLSSSNVSMVTSNTSAITSSSISNCPSVSRHCLPGSSHMEVMASELMSDLPMTRLQGNDLPSFSLPPDLRRSANPACRLAPSPGFLRPLTSFTNSPFWSSSPPSHTAPASNLTPYGSDYFNNNNNNNIFSNNNSSNQNNGMEMFDSLDDEMQL